MALYINVMGGSGIGLVFTVTFLISLYYLQCVVSETEDLYNTKSITSDLGWTAHPLYGGWEEVSGIYHGSPIRFYQICNLDNQEDANNWIRSPYINSRGARRVYIECEFSMMKCDEEFERNCRETFNLYMYESNDDIASSTFPPWREQPYMKIDTIAAGQRFVTGDTDKGVNRKTWTIGPLKKSGFYISAHDRGACMSLLSVRVYYYYCPPITRALASFPRTVAGEYATSLLPVEGNCVHNSIDVSVSGRPLFHCNSDGEWKVRTGSCQCRAGFQSDNEMKRCQPCGDGKYKMQDGNFQCNKCPAHSENNKSLLENSRNSLAYCECVSGYYRANGEDVHQPCTKPPTKPTNLEATINNTYAELAWSEPEDKGGRVDVHYKVTCEVCGSDEYNDCSACSNEVRFIPNSPGNMTETSAQIANLLPFSYYKFKVYSLSGVSSVAPKQPAHEEVFAMSNQAAPSKILGIRAVNRTSTSLTYVWATPHQPNGIIAGYQLSIVESGRIHKQDENMGNIIFVKDPLVPTLIETKNRTLVVRDLLPNTHYTAKIRARTAAGYGEYSDAYTTSTGSAQVLKSHDTSSNIGLIAGVAGVALLMAIASVVICYMTIKRRRSNQGSTEKVNSVALDQQLVVHLPEKNNQHKMYVEYSDPRKAVNSFVKELDKNQLTVQENIGQGEFGDVFCGKIKSGNKNFERVAIKQLKPGATLTDQVNFLREASRMGQFQHNNVLQLKGVVTKSQPFMIVSEFMGNGSLDTFLRNNKDSLCSTQLLQMLHGIAEGMQYLSEMQYVHRDLAARNILVGGNLVCKVSDFGLARNFENEPNATYTTQGGKIALRWTAPESIKYREFTSASDVWSFGILMWEVMSFAEYPYWDMTNQDVIESIEEGFRLPAPNECSSALHHLMIECWAYNAQQRPSFAQIEKIIAEFLLDSDKLICDAANISAPQPVTNSALPQT